MTDTPLAHPANETTEHSASRRLRYDAIPSLLRSYAVPAVVGTVVNSLYNIVDRIFIGQGVSALAISGLAVTFPILIFLQAFGMLIGVGASSRISILLGQKEHAKAENLLGNAFVLSLLLSVTTIGLSLLFLKPLLMSFGASEETLPYAMEYLSIALPGNIFANLCFTYNAVMRSSGYPRKAMYTMIIGAVLNTVLDPIFIFGFGMGVKGAAIATVISMFVGMCYVMRHFMGRDSYLKLKGRYFRLEGQYVKGIFSIGMAPFMVQMTASVVTVFFTQSLQAHGGDYAVAAYGVQSSYAMLVVMLMIGVSQGMQPIAGFNYGARAMDRVKEVYALTRRVNVGVGTVGALLAVLLPEAIASVFSSDPALLPISSRSLRLVMWALWAVGYQVSITLFFQSIGYAKRSIFLSLCRQVIFLLPLLFLFQSWWGVDGIWLSFPVADTLAAVISGVMVHRFVQRL